MIVRSSTDTMLLVEWEQKIDPAINQCAIALAARLETRVGHLVRDIVPGYCSLGVHYDPLLTDSAVLERAIAEETREVADAETSPDHPLIEIPVCYGGTDGPDLESVAEFASCTAAEVVERHANRTYRVYMLGFVPGFAYMGSVEPSIAAPRHRVPRERVPAGSVGIAGEQTGVYPIATPGGWQLIGRTETLLFEPARTPPNLVRPGDRVRFVPVTCAR